MLAIRGIGSVKITTLDELPDNYPLLNPKKDDENKTDK